MRALAKLLFTAVGAVLILGSCKTAGVRYVVMSISDDGTDPRSTFFADSKSISCVAKMSVGDPDTYVEAVIRRHANVDWDNSSPRNPNQFIAVTPPSIFAAQEVKLGTGPEQNAAFSILTTGTNATIPCIGSCVPDAPPSVNPCPAGYEFQGNDSCGPGAACCFNPFGMMAQQNQSVLPYPVGVYECDIYVNGDPQGSANFTIEYQCSQGEQVSGEGPGPCCPTLPPSAGVPCRNWVPKGTQCTSYSDPQITCTCLNAADPASTYFWECQ